MSRKLRLLVVEDNDDDEFLLLRTLRKGGFDLTHQRVETAEQMREALSTTQFDLIISDYSLPQFSAPAALAVFQEFNLDIPFVIQSGTVGEETAVAAMRAGASDFITKGNHRLLPAIDRELREAEGRRAHRGAEQRFRSLIENALDIITVVDADGRIKFANRSPSGPSANAPEENPRRSSGCGRNPRIAGGPAVQSARARPGPPRESALPDRQSGRSPGAPRNSVARGRPADQLLRPRARVRSRVPAAARRGPGRCQDGTAPGIASLKKELCQSATSAEQGLANRLKGSPWATRKTTWNPPLSVDHVASRPG